MVAVGPVSDAINGIHAGCSVTDRPVTGWALIVTGMLLEVELLLSWWACRTATASCTLKDKA